MDLQQYTKKLCKSVRKEENVIPVGTAKERVKKLKDKIKAPFKKIKR